MAYIIGLIIAIFVAIGARRLGYSGIVWFFAMGFGGPFTLGLVSALPDRALERKRRNLLTELQLELVNARRITGETTVIDSETIGQHPTTR
jgi:hypothetical protein